MTADTKNLFVVMAIAAMTIALIWRITALRNIVFPAAAE